MKTKDINRLVEDTLNSLDGTNEVNSFDPDNFLFGKIMSDVNQKENGFMNENNSFGKIAIAFAVIVLINIFSIINFYNSSENKYTGETQNYSKAVNEFAKQYFSGQNEYDYNRK